MANKDREVLHFRINDKNTKVDLKKAAKAYHRSFAAHCAFILEEWIGKWKRGETFKTNV